MLDAFIIEEIKRRERLRQEQEEERERPFLDLPLPIPEEAPRRRGNTENERPQRGVVVLDLAV